MNSNNDECAAYNAQCLKDAKNAFTDPKDIREAQNLCFQNTQVMRMAVLAARHGDKIENLLKTLGFTNSDNKTTTK